MNIQQRVISTLCFCLFCIHAQAQYTPIVYSYEGSFNEESTDFGLRISHAGLEGPHMYLGDFLVVLSQRSGSETYHFRLNSEYFSAYDYSIERLSGSTYSDEIYMIENTATSFNIEIRFKGGGDDDWHRVTVHQLAPSGGNTPAFLKIDPSQYMAGGTKVPTTIFKKGENGIGIGTANPTNTLDVNGTIRSREVHVEATGWPDYVFEEDYDLPGLDEIEVFIKANKHLPEIPSAAYTEEHGIRLGEMNTLLLKKIEELTLYLIEQEKVKNELLHKLEQEQTTNISQQEMMNKLFKRIEKLESTFTRDSEQQSKEKDG
ncbi:MAG: hypothetical protein AAFW89_10225 [Bacteroidota bacterium]